MAELPAGTGGGGKTRLTLPETEARTAARAEARHGAGERARRLGDYGTARAQWMESLAIHRERGSKGGIAKSLEGLAAVLELGDRTPDA